MHRAKQRLPLSRQRTLCESAGLLLAPLLLLSGCAAPREAVRTEPLQADSARSSTEQRAARAAIEQLVRAQYAAIERGDLREWGTGFSPDVLLLGSDPTEVMSGRDVVVSRMTRAAAPRMAASVSRTYASRRLRIGLAPDGESAWVADEIDYTRVSGGVKKSVQFRVSQVAVKLGARWQIALAHYSTPVPDARAFATSWPLPAELPAQVAPGAESLAALIGDAPMDHFPGAFADSAAVLLIGTSAAEWIEGGAAAQKFTGQGSPGHLGVQRRGGLHVGMSASGSLGWAVWNATLTVPHGAEKTALPVRVSQVFLRQGAQWQKVQEHVSIAIPD